VSVKHGECGGYRALEPALTKTVVIMVYKLDKIVMIHWQPEAASLLDFSELRSRISIDRGQVWACSSKLHHFNLLGDLLYNQMYSTSPTNQSNGV